MQQSLDNPVDVKHNHYSTSQQRYERFERRKYWRRAIAILYVVCVCGYLIWRLSIFNTDHLWLSIVYFVAECMGFLLGFTIVMNSWRYRHRIPKPPPKPDEYSVDVLVPVYKEPLPVIRRTLMAAKNIDYAHNTIVLDDGRRPEIKTLATELGITYLSRTSNQHAKAGNLNFGLAHSTADFVMVFDADHIAMPHALDVMLGFFADKQVAMVQTPQNYYNNDAFQYMNAKQRRGATALWHDQSFFYDVALSCGDASNAATCVGTGVVYRRAALDAIGGIPTTTVTEDLHTSLKLHKADFQTVYLNEAIAYGIAAADLEEYNKTRHRWAHGNLHAIAHENVLFSKGLTLAQRLSYLSLGLIYLEGWQQLLLFLIPVITLTFGIPPFEITIFNVLVVLLFPFFNYALLQEMGCGYARFWPNEFFSMARWPIHIRATIGLLGRKIRWRSSSKNIKGRVYWQLMWPQLTIIILSAMAIGVAVGRLVADFQTGPLYDFMAGWFVGDSSSVVGDSSNDEGASNQAVNIFASMGEGYTLELVAIAGAWATYTILRASYFIGKAVRDAKRSKRFFRFALPLPVTYQYSQSMGQTDQVESSGCISSISEDWLELNLHDSLQLQCDDQLNCIVHLPSGGLPVRMKIVSIRRGQSSIHVSGSILWSSEMARDQLAATLYSVDWHREFLHRPVAFATFMDWVGRLFSLKLLPSSFCQHRCSYALLFSENGSAAQSAGVITAIAKPRNLEDAVLLCAKPLDMTTRYHAVIISDQQVKTVSFKVKQPLAMSSLVVKNLDGIVMRKYRVELQPLSGNCSTHDLIPA